MVRVLHIFYSFLPDVSGSSIRSAGIVSGQTQLGVIAGAICSPFQPGPTAAPVDQCGPVRIHRTYKQGNPLISEKGSSLRSRLHKVVLFPSFVLAVMRVARQERAEVLHAHSTFYCGLAALIAGRLMGLQVVYEFRSLWEERARHRNPVYRIQSAVATFLESRTLRAADRVVAINDALRDLIIKRGVDSRRAFVVPNAVDDPVLAMGARVPAPVHFQRFGYVGSFSPIEGLDLLVDAFVMEFANDSTATLTFWGGGVYEGELRRLVEATHHPGIAIRGRFSREQLSDVYSTLDCVVLARKRSLLTDTVTPLKPLEAMAFGRLVVASDVKGLVEVIGDADRARFFSADDVASLRRTLRAVADDVLVHSQITEAGRRFVQEQRAWSGVAALYSEVYRDRSTNA